MLYNLEGQDGDTEQVDEGMLKLTGKPVKWDLTIREPGQQPRAQLGGPEPTPDEEGEVAPAEPEAEEAEPEDNAGNDEMEADDNADMDSNADDANADGMESSNNG